jgi:ribosomal protein S18 acetylase RimI-like enzyme
MAYPTTFDTNLNDFPADKLGPVGQDAWRQLGEKGYEIKTGLTAEVAAAIYKLSLEPSIREYCPKDSSERFRDEPAVQLWLQKGRAVFLLVQKDTGSVVGYGWAGPGTSTKVEGDTTFAIRIAEAGQGQGLATSYTRLIIAGAAILFGAKNFWLETWQSNAGAVHVYHKIGAQDAGQEASQRPTMAGGTVQDTRLYMVLPGQLLNS